MANNKKILIVGGGIAGLGLARALHLRGWSPRLVEIQPTWPVAGTGIYLPANGVAALQQLGLADAARSRGFTIDRRYIVTAQGASLFDLDLETVWGREQPCLAMHRRVLHEVLLEGATDIDLTLGMTAARIDNRPDGVEVELSDGSQERFDLVVGADGIRSAVRAAVLGKVNLREVTALTCRFVTARPAEIQAWTMIMSQFGQILMLPISADELYCYINRKPQGSSWPSKTEYLTPFEGFAAPVPQVLAGWSVNTSHWSRIEELQPLPVWGQGRVVLIGDAAHAMPPFMAQGGSLALEDALVLARLLEEIDWSQAAQALTERRRERVNWVRTRNQFRERGANWPFFLLKIANKLAGRRSWTADYEPLREPPEGL
ncbi:FAD-dependent monooxygenase [Chloroflexi bacterium TSY]|nr:FAD-dependent monooxygenase [Chloroflexi bacterium TSY]